MSVLKGEGKVPILFGSTSIAAGNPTLGGYLARPDLQGEWPTIIVVSSAFGLTSNVKDLVRKLAREGFAVVAPDLYRGQKPPRFPDAGAAEAAFSRLDQRPVRDLLAIASFIRNPAGFFSNAERGAGMFVIGTGAEAGITAAAQIGPAAMAVAYPVGIAGENMLQRLGAVGTTPLLGLVGRDDDRVTLDDVAAARRVAPQSEWVVYDATGHDFLDDGQPDYERGTAMDAISRIAGFFEKHLPPMA